MKKPFPYFEIGKVPAGYRNLPFVDSGIDTIFAPESGTNLIWTKVEP